jgi:hypothetical protein
MVDGSKLAEVGFQYLGTPYKEMDCQAFIERCLKDCGDNKNLPGSNAWYRECMNNGYVCTPEECVSLVGYVPKGAFLFILSDVDEHTPEKYRHDGIGDAKHIGIVTGRGKGAIHSSESRGCVCESEFHDKTIKNGGWNRVGFWAKVDYGVDIDDEPIADDSGIPSEPDDGFPADTGWHPTIRRGSKGDDVILLQTMLYKLGYGLGVDGIDGDYGRNTEKAVKEFQSDQRLTVDGVCGPMTWDALEKAVAKLTAEPKEKTYTVCIHHLDKTQAETMQRNYPGCVVTEE